jgi:hypothetical protein
VTPNVTGIERMDSPHEYLFSRGGAAQAVRDERWKLMVSAPPEADQKEWLFDLTAEGERVDLLAEHPEVAGRLRGALEAHNEAQAEPLWPWATANAHNVDRDLSKDDQPEDEFAYSSD